MKKRILFFGTPEIAVPSLETIAELDNYEVVGVGVFPDRLVGRKQMLTPCAVKTAALSLNLPVYELDSKADLKKIFKKVECDLAIVIAFGMMFPESVLKTPPLGVVNVHFSLLPDFRGASPVQAAILANLNKSGITWQRMVKSLDAGDILWQTTHDISHQTTAQVWEKFSYFTAETFPKFLDAYTQARIIPQPQKETAATFCGKFEKQDGYLNPQIHSALEIYNTWRAFQPWPGVSLKTASGLIKLVEISLESVPESVALNCAQNSTLWLQTGQIPSKKPQPFTQILAQNPDFFLVTD